MRLMVGGLYCANDACEGKSRPYIQNTAPMVRAAAIKPSVMVVKIAPKKENMNRTKGTSRFFRVYTGEKDIRQDSFQLPACYCRIWEARAASDRYQSKIPATIAREKRVRHSGDFKFSRSCFDDINPASTSIEGMSGAFSTEKFACRMGREFTRPNSINTASTTAPASSLDRRVVSSRARSIKMPDTSSSAPRRSTPNRISPLSCRRASLAVA